MSTANQSGAYKLRDLTGEVLIITGATSGIGRQTAYAAVAAGAKVVLNARTKEKLAEIGLLNKTDKSVISRKQLNKKRSTFYSTEL